MRIAQIKDFPDYYISDDGKIFSDKTNKYRVRRGWKELNGFINKGGYKYVDLVDGCRRKRYAIHQLVALYFCTGYFDGAVVDHKDANKLNNNYRNLQWITQRDNVNKSYIDSSINQVRNYKQYKLTSPENEIFLFYKGYNDVELFINKNNINISPLSLRNNKQSKGWKLEIFDKNEVIDDE